MSESGVRRVTVHAGTVHVDLTLPAAVPVGSLIPPIVDIVAAGAGRRADFSGDPVPAHYQLSRVGAAALDASMTLAQQVIRDGTVLVLSRSSTELPAPCFDDAAEAVATTLDAVARPWTRRAARLTAAVTASWLAGVGGLTLIRTAFGATGARHIGTTAAVSAAASGVALFAAAIAHRAYRDTIAGLTLGLLATGFAAVAGLLAVPGAPGASNVLLAAMAAAVVSVLAIRITGCGTVTLTAVSCFAVVTAIAALAGAVSAAPLRAIGAISAVISLGLLEASTRVSIVVAGLSPRLPSTLHAEADDTTPVAERLSTRAIRANDLLTGLVAAFSAVVALGAISSAVAVHITGAPPLGGIAFAAVAGAALLLRARSPSDLPKTAMLVATGTATISSAFVAAAAAFPQHTAWIAAAVATLTGAALWLGFAAPTMTVVPVARRSMDLLAYLALVAIVPLACWISGIYGAARGMNLT